MALLFHLNRNVFIFIYWVYHAAGIYQEIFAGFRKILVFFLS